MPGAPFPLGAGGPQQTEICRKRIENALGTKDHAAAERIRAAGERKSAHLAAEVERMQKDLRSADPQASNSSSSAGPAEGGQSRGEGGQSRREDAPGETPMPEVPQFLEGEESMPKKRRSESIGSKGASDLPTEEQNEDAMRESTTPSGVQDARAGAYRPF